MGGKERLKFNSLLFEGGLTIEHRSRSHYIALAGLELPTFSEWWDHRGVLLHPARIRFPRSSCSMTPHSITPLVPKGSWGSTDHFGVCFWSPHLFCLPPMLELGLLFGYPAVVFQTADRKLTLLHHFLKTFFFLASLPVSASCVLPQLDALHSHPNPSNL